MMTVVILCIVIFCMMVSSWSTFIKKANNILFTLVKHPEQTIEYQLQIQLQIIEVNCYPLHSIIKVKWGPYYIEMLQIRLTKPRYISIHRNKTYICEYKDIPIQYRIRLYHEYLKKYYPIKAKWYAWILKLNFKNRGNSWFKAKASTYMGKFLENLMENMSVTDIKKGN